MRNKNHEIEKMEIIGFIKKLIEDQDINTQFNKAFIDQHIGFFQTKSLLKILISAFKFFFSKKGIH